MPYLSANVDQVADEFRADGQRLRVFVEQPLGLQRRITCEHLQRSPDPLEKKSGVRGDRSDVTDDPPM